MTDEWKRHARAGHFEAMPCPLRWTDAREIAIWLDGYAEAGGIDELGSLANSREHTARATGEWKGNAIELWLCLFFEQRRERFSWGSEAESADRLDTLSETLRQRLIELKPEERELLIAKFRT